MLAGLGMGVSDASATVGPSAVFPPDGWDHLCSGNTIDVKPTVTERRYSATGACWINVAKDKANGDEQVWVSVPALLEGIYDIPNNRFQEKLTIGKGFNINIGSTQVYVPPTVIASSSTCTDDPWATHAQCSPAKLSGDIYSSFGWSINAPPPGPLSRNVLGAELVTALLSKKLSKPPLPPVDVDVVRWPDWDGKGQIGRVFWRAPDVSDNKWILAYEIEYVMNSPNAAFSQAGKEVGPGAKSQLSQAEVMRFYYSTFKLSGADYYFRVCTVNDSGRQCSAAVKAREQTNAERIGTASHTMNSGLGKIGGNTSGGNTTAAPPAGAARAPTALAPPPPGTPPTAAAPAGGPPKLAPPPPGVAPAAPARRVTR
jgi:hypothetical protein